jgi:hypothetical protein
LTSGHRKKSGACLIDWCLQVNGFWRPNINGERSLTLWQANAPGPITEEAMEALQIQALLALQTKPLVRRQSGAPVEIESTAWRFANWLIDSAACGRHFRQFKKKDTKETTKVYEKRAQKSKNLGARNSGVYGNCWLVWGLSQLFFEALIAPRSART